MKKLTKFLLNSIVSDSRKVKINKKEEDNLITLDVKVSPEDIGRVIGKNGRTVKALTSLLRIKAIKQGKRVFLKIQESVD